MIDEALHSLEKGKSNPSSFNAMFVASFPAHNFASVNEWVFARLVQIVTTALRWVYRSLYVHVTEPLLITRLLTHRRACAIPPSKTTIPFYTGNCVFGAPLLQKIYTLHRRH